MEPDDHRFAIQFAYCHPPLQRPALVIPEVRKIAELAQEGVAHLKASIGSNEFSDAVPVALVETVDIKTQQVRDLSVLRAWPLRLFGQAGQFRAAALERRLHATHSGIDLFRYLLEGVIKHI